MFIRFSHGAVALLATTALTQAALVYAQETTAAETGSDTVAEQSDERVLGPVVVRGAFIPDEKRQTSEVASLIDAEDFSVRGDSDVAAALRRATGVSLDSGGKFVFVRGLNERYTNSTLNGSIIPSPEPLRKVAPLDLFPTSVLASTFVQKTFSPELSAEFGGGSLDIRTKAVPDENFFEIGGSFGGDSISTLEDGFLFDGGDDDYLGIDDGTRNLPAGLDEVLRGGAYQQLGFEDRNRIAQELTDDSSLLVVQEGIVGFDFGFDASGGYRMDVNDDLSIGLLGALSYSNEWTTREGVQGIGQTSPDFDVPVDALSQLDRRSTKNTIGLNGLASIGFDIFDNHEIKALAFGTRSTDKEAEVRIGFTNDDDVRRETLEWIERQLWTTQIQGAHVFPSLLDLEVDWRASYSQAERDAPYSYTTQYEFTTTGVPRIVEGSNFEFSTIDDETTDWGIDFLLPLYLADREINLKAGYAYTEKDRESQNDNLVLSQPLPIAIGTLRVDAAYATYFADPANAFQNVRSSQSPAFYVATQETDAFYAGIDAEITPFLRIALGARYEDFIQAVETRTGEDTFGIITPPLEDDRVRPAATLTWNFADDLQLRLGYSETTNRPQFREVGPSRFTNTETNEQFIGNPFLTKTDITNYDARLEWYFGRDQFVTIGAFYKDLENPIEAFNVGSGESRLVTFVNITGAEVQGMEFEFQKDLDFQDWFGASWLGSKEFSIVTNYTYSESEIDASDNVIFLDQTAASRIATTANGLEQTLLYEIGTDANGNAVLFPAGTDPTLTGISNSVTIRDPNFEPGRQLQGQSEHLANFQIGYFDPDAGADLNLLVNFQSERIRSVEDRNEGTPAIIEEPPITLDLVYGRDLTIGGGNYRLGFKVQNILGDEYEAYQEAAGGRVDVDVYEIGTSVSFSIKRDF